MEQAGLELEPELELPEMPEGRSVVILGVSEVTRLALTKLLSLFSGLLSSSHLSPLLVLLTLAPLATSQTSEHW